MPTPHGGTSTSDEPGIDDGRKMTKTTETTPAPEPPEEVAQTDRVLAFDESATVYARMAAVLAELPAIGKGQWNEQQKFHFRGHDDVMNALNPLLAKHGLFILPRVLERATAQRPTRSGGVLFEVNLHVEYRFVGIAGDEVVATAWGEGTDSGDKATSKSMTMALKSALGQVFALATGDTVDPDATGVEQSVAGEPRKRQSGGSTRRDPNATASQEDLTRLFAALGELGKYDATYDRTWLVRSILDNYACESPKNLTVEQSGTITGWVRGEVKRRKDAGEQPQEPPVEPAAAAEPADDAEPASGAEDAAETP